MKSNDQLERSTLSTVLSNCFYADDARILIESLEEEDFEYDKYRKIFNLIRRYHDNKYPLSVETLIMNGDISSDDLLPVADSPCGEAKFLLPMLRRNRMQREAMYCAEKFRREIEASSHSELIIEQIDEYIDKFKTIQKLAPHSTWRGYNDVANDGFSILSRRYNEKASCFIETGFRKLDKTIGGLRPGNLVIVAARPGQGKTALLLDILRNISEAGFKSAFLSMEMSEEDIYNRQICKLTDIPIQVLYHPKELQNSHDDWERIARASETIHSWTILLIDKPLTLSQTLSKCRDAARQGCKVIAIDQLSKIKGSDRKNFYENATEAVTSLSILTKELNVTIILLSQINRRANEEKSNEPELWMLKNTGALEEEADIVLLIHRPWEYTQKKEDEGKALIKIAKNRNGRTGTIEMWWVKDRCAFVE